MEAKQGRIPKQITEIASFSLKGGLLTLGIYHIAMTSNLDQFLSWLKSINPQRGDALARAIEADPNDELRLLQSVTPLSDRQGLALANKAAKARIITEKGKLHQGILRVIGDVAHEMINSGKKKR